MTNAPTFDHHAVPDLTWDFTGILAQDGSGPCTGKGTIASPSWSQLTRFDVFRVTMNGWRPSDQHDGVERARMLDAITEIAGEDGPTREQLEALRPLALRALFEWLVQQFKSPVEGALV